MSFVDSFLAMTPAWRKRSAETFRSERALARQHLAEVAISQSDPRALGALLEDKTTFTPERLLLLAPSACRAEKNSDALTRELLNAGLSPLASFITGAGRQTPLQVCFLAGNWEAGARFALAIPRMDTPAMSALGWIHDRLRESPLKTLEDRQSVDSLTRAFAGMAPGSDDLAQEIHALVGLNRFLPEALLDSAPIPAELNAAKALSARSEGAAQTPPLCASASLLRPSPHDAPSPRRILARKHGP